MAQAHFPELLHSQY